MFGQHSSPPLFFVDQMPKDLLLGLQVRDLDNLGTARDSVMIFVRC